MVLIDESYFTIDSLETQLRSCFDYDEMWNINFKEHINKMTEVPEGFELIIKNKRILVDKFSGLVLSVEEK